MQLIELRKQIIETNDDFWHRIDIGPYYHDRLHVPGDLEFTGSSHSHYSRFVLTHDVRISIEWGMDANFRGDETHPWTDTAAFPDKRSSTEVVDIFLNGALVDRSTVISVDGGRAYLPSYSNARVDGETSTDWDNAVYEQHATYWDYYLAQLVDQLSGHREFDRYVKQSGIKLKEHSTIGE